MALAECRECGKKVSTLAKSCPSCGVPRPVKKIKKIKKVKKVSNKRIKEINPEFEKIWVHCRNYKCRDYTQMYNIYKSYLSLEKCKFCNSKFIEAKLNNGKPEMPTDGIYDKLDDNERKNITKRGSSNSSNKSNTFKKSSEDKDVFGKFYDGELDLATAFWGFGVFGSFIIGFILAYVAESFSKVAYIPYFVVQAGIVLALWSCADNHKKIKNSKKESPVWAYLTQIYCVLGGFGLASVAYDILKQF